MTASACSRVVRLPPPVAEAVAEAETLDGESAAGFLTRAVRSHRWLREQRSRGARVLVEDGSGRLREVPWPAGGAP